MVKLGFFSNQFSSSVGHGIQTYSKNLYNQLKLNFSDSLRIVPISASAHCSPKELKKLQKETGLELLKSGRVLTPLLWKFLNYPKIESELKSEIDLLHLHSLSYPIATNKPMVVTIHDIGPLTHPHFFTKKDQILIQYGLKQAVRKASKIICVSESTANSVKSFVKKNYNTYLEDRLCIIHEGVDEIYFKQPNYEEIKDMNKINDLIHKPFILAVGKISPRKNLETILRVFSQLKNELPDYQVIAVGGNGWDYKNIIQLVSNLKIEDRVHFIGHVSNNLLRLLYSTAQIFLYPSLFEGFGLPILEAMASGCPVITSNTTSLKEISGKAAITINPLNEEEISDSILQLSKNENFKNKLINKGLKRAKSFNWKNTAELTYQEYINILQ